MASKILKKFRDYWNEWHEKWHQNFSFQDNPSESYIHDYWLKPIEIKIGKKELRELLEKDPATKEMIKTDGEGKLQSIDELHQIINNYFYVLEKSNQTDFLAKSTGIAETKYSKGTERAPSVKDQCLAVHKAIPEPYWISEKIMEGRTLPCAVFFNINPGPNKFYHLMDSSTISIDAKFNQDKVWDNDADNVKNIHNWSEVYLSSGSKKPIKYSDYINKLIETYAKEEKFWHVEKRVNWVKQINSNETQGIGLEHIANLEYYPFHTNSADEIRSYWIDRKKHYKFLFEPAVYLCQKVKTLELQNKIISRGNWQNGWKSYFEHLKINNKWKLHDKSIIVYPRKNKNKEKGSVAYTLNVCLKKYKKKTVYFLNFDGGGANAQAMSLPSISSKDSVCLIEVYGDKYISVYFDEFMREIDEYIF